MPIIQTSGPLPDRVPLDFYPTPEKLVNRMAEEALYYLPADVPDDRLRILDPGCGTGVFGKALQGRTLGWPHIVGIELDPGRAVEARKTGAYSVVLTIPYAEYKSRLGFDLIIGNPPYYLAEAFVRQSLDLLNPDGTIMFLLRTAFMESQGRYHRLFKRRETRPTEVWSLVERPSFTGNNKTGSDAYAIFIWERRRNHRFPDFTSLKWLSWR